MEVADVIDNINGHLSTYHLDDEDGPFRPIVCVLCDRFIVPDSNKYISYTMLNTHQELFYADEQLGLCPELKACYQVNFPENMHLPREITDSLQITNCLLSPRSTYVLSDSGTNGYHICTECDAYLTRGLRPKFCIASNFCFGTPPPCLTELTEIELAFISPVKTYGHIFCYTGGQQHKIKGSLAYYKTNHDQVIQNFANMAAANANIVVILYGELTQQQYNIKRQYSKIRIGMIHAAIRWLIQYNSEWKNCICKDIDEFILTIKNPRVLRLCEIVPDDDLVTELNENYTVYYPDGSMSNHNGGQESIEKLQELVRVATLNKNDMILQQDLAKESVNCHKDNNFANSSLLQFPYGRGGLQDERLLSQNDLTTSIDIEKYVEFLKMVSIPYFHEGLFCLKLYNMMVKQYMFRTASWQLRQTIDPRVLANELHVDDVEQALNANKLARGLVIPDQINANRFLKSIDTVCNSAPHSNAAAKKAKLQAKAIQHKFGSPTLFLTVTPDDDNCYSIQVLSGEIIDKRAEKVSMATDQELYERAKKRTALRLKYPGICALYFELALNTVIQEVLGWDRGKNKQTKKGLFGKIDAFTCSIEEQGRGTLHAHFLIWMSKINKRREDLHNLDNPNKRQYAARVIKKMIDKVTSTRCFFNDEEYLATDREWNRRERFPHKCNNQSYGLPNFASDEQLLNLRTQGATNEKVINCRCCDFKWNYDDIQNSYLIDFIGVPFFSSINNESSVKRLKALAVEYQANSRQETISHYAIDFGYNSHRHCKSCFKYCKNSKMKIFDINATSCRYRFPQKCRKKTIIQNISPTMLPWYNWNGTFVERHILEICVERKEHDAFQNDYCPAISYSKLACNSNIKFLTPGPACEYVFDYSLKGTQYEDTEPYEKLKAVLAKVLSVVKHQYNDNLEATRRLLYASFTHQSNDTIRPTMAAYLTRNKTRFIMSHNFVNCPLRDLRSITLGEEVPVGLSFHNSIPHFHCFAMHYLCRPESLEMLNPYQFYSKYEVIKCSQKALKSGAERFINNPSFHHPSFNHKTQLCEMGVKKRKMPCLVKIFQFDFIDAANFDCDILINDSPITDEIESYCQLILLLFIPYRCDADLKIEDKYTIFLREAMEKGDITSEYITFLQNIQDSKGNCFRHKITIDELYRASEPFHDTIDNEAGILEIGDAFDGEFLGDNNFDLQAELIDYLISDSNDAEENFDIHNDLNVHFNMNILRNKGENGSGTNNLPEITPINMQEDVYVQGNSFVETDYDENDTIAQTNVDIKVINMKKDKIAFFMNCDNRIDLSLKEIGFDEDVDDVLSANGTAASIVDWAMKCKLDIPQQRAFEIIAGYYILSYIYDITLLDDEHDNDNVTIQQERDRLEILVGRNHINSEQLICFVHGPAGSGKSTVISLLQLYSKKYHVSLDNDAYNRSIVLTAMTGVAATLIGGETAHSALYLNHTDIKNVSQESVELWTNTKLLIIDEISFASNNTIKKIETNLHHLKGKSAPFGGIHIVFCGDLRQLEPIREAPLYRNHQKQHSVFKSLINCYIELNGQHRFGQDPEWGELLTRFREGVPTRNDIIKINTRVVKDKKKELPHNIKYATFCNSDRDAINTGIFLNKLKHCNDSYHNNFIVIFCDQMKIKKCDKFIPFTHKKLFYEQCGESDIDTGRQGRFDPVLKLYDGCEVMLTENIDVINGLANGTQALVQKIILNQGASFTYITVSNNLRVKAVFATDVNYILLKHKNERIIEQLFKIKPKQKTFNATLPVPHDLQFVNIKQDKPKVPMQAKQIPFVVNNATTGHKLQGTGVDKLFVHAWRYEKNWPYVVLSRVKQLSGLFLRTELLVKPFKYKMDRDLISLITYLRKMLPLPEDN